MYSLHDLSCYVLDMDGTIYLGNKVIPGAQELLYLFDQRKIPYYFFTNNSSKSPTTYIEKLHRLGFGSFQRERIITSGDVTADYVIRTYGKSAHAYVVGTDDLIAQFEASGIICTQDLTPDCVVVGFDTTFDFGKASRAVDLLREGVPFLATNIDAVCPLENDMVLPDCASMCAMLTHASGAVPKYLGKPFAETAAYIEKITQVPAHKTAVIGDRLYTDIRLAVDNDMCAIGVLSGEMTKQDIAQSDKPPHMLFGSVRELYDELV